MILVMAGTSDGKALAATLQSNGFQVMVTVTSPYGEALAKEQGLNVHTGPLDGEALRSLIANEGIRILVDATHPYAQQASVTAMEAAEAENIPYFRYERPVSSSAEDFISPFSGLDSLCEAVENEPGNILLTLGSNQLNAFSGLGNRDNLYIRILPVPSLMEKSIGYGFRSDHILAMQGPFSQAFNEALIRQWNISVIVTKDSSGAGGFSEKVEAARNTGIRLFLLKRPEIVYRNAFDSPDGLIRMIAQTLKELP